jgi:hypothetical protein
VLEQLLRGLCARRPRRRQPRPLVWGSVGGGGGEGVDDGSGVASVTPSGEQQQSQQQREPWTHFSGLVRREERTRRRKRLRREWLRKLHARGLLPLGAGEVGGAGSPGEQQDAHSSGGGGEPQASQPAAAAGAEAESEDEALLQDLERRLQLGFDSDAGQQPARAPATSNAEPDDALLQWCQALDFQAYAAGWAAAACTAASEAAAQGLVAEAALIARMAAAQRQEEAAPAAGRQAATGLRWPPFQGGALPAEGVTSGLALRV